MDATRRQPVVIDYLGETVAGKADGNGVAEYSLKNGNNTVIAKYKGQWKDGMRHGFGTMVYRDGMEYEGEWKYDKKDGTGSMVGLDGIKMFGEFKDNKLCDLSFKESIRNYVATTKVHLQNILDGTSPISIHDIMSSTLLSAILLVILSVYYFVA